MIDDRDTNASNDAASPKLPPAASAPGAGMAVALTSAWRDLMIVICGVRWPICGIGVSGVSASALSLSSRKSPIDAKLS